MGVLEKKYFGRKSKIWSKIESLVENGSSGQTSKLFGRKSKFWTKIEMLSKMEVLVENLFLAH